MELYEVVIEHKDVLAHKDWDKRLEDWSVKASRGLERGHFDESPPPYKRVTYHAAVFGRWAGEPVKTACDLAVRAVVGEPKSWDEWHPTIQSVRWIGSVAVEPAEVEPQHGPANEELAS